MLESFIRTERQNKDILLMTHLVLGYPSLEENFSMIEKMSLAGVELIELQIPFSEPIADGAVILKANHISLNNGIHVRDCFLFAEKVITQFPRIAFLFMTYYNILFSYKENDFLSKANRIGIRGLIIPDLPPEEGKDYITIAARENLAAIFIFTPTNTKKRLRILGKSSTGLVYTVGRRGVTGAKTSFDKETSELISQYRDATNLPLAMGFGIREKADVDFLTGKVDIAVIGTQLIRTWETSGVEAAGKFLQGLR